MNADSLNFPQVLWAIALDSSAAIAGDLENLRTQMNADKCNADKCNKVQIGVDLSSSCFLCSLCVSVVQKI